MAAEHSSQRSDVRSGCFGRLYGFHLNDIHQEGKGHREVDVTLRNFEMQSFSYQGYTNHHQEAQCQNFEGWVFSDETADRPRSDQHDDYGYNYCRVHDPEFLYHTYSCDD